MPGKTFATIKSVEGWSLQDSNLRFQLRNTNFTDNCHTYGTKVLNDVRHIGDLRLKPLGQDSTLGNNLKRDVLLESNQRPAT